jgi:hypothetical protein
MTWIELHANVFSDRKVLAAAIALTRGDVEKMVGHLARLWSWSMDNAEDGDLSHLPDHAIGLAAGWTKRPKNFVATLRAVGLIDPDGQIHDWDDYAGRLRDRREKDRIRKKMQRQIERARDASSPGMSMGQSSGSPGDVPTAPYPTAPDRTEQMTTTAAHTAEDVQEVDDALELLRHTKWYGEWNAVLDRGVLAGAKVAGVRFLRIEVERWIERGSKMRPDSPRAALRGWLDKAAKSEPRPHVVTPEEQAALDAFSANPTEETKIALREARRDRRDVVGPLPSLDEQFAALRANRR